MIHWKIKEIEQRDLEAFIEFYEFESVEKFAKLLTNNKRHQRVFVLRYKKQMPFKQIAKEVCITNVMCKTAYKQCLQYAEGWRYTKENQEIYWETGVAPEIIIENLPCKQLLRTACWRGEIITLQQLASLKLWQFKETRGAGKIVIENAKEFLKMFGMCFADEKIENGYQTDARIQSIRSARAALAKKESETNQKEKKE